MAPEINRLVSTQWLEEHLGDKHLIVLDCSVRTLQSEQGMRNESAWQEYAEAHIPTAGFADLKGDLTRDDPVEFSLPSPQEFCAAMGKLGVGDDTAVVLYDTTFSAWAARVWWMLRWVGFDNAALLDGGFKAWKEEGRAISSEESDLPVRKLTPHPRPGVIADRDEVRSAIGGDSVMLIDTLPPNLYSGQDAMYGRPGHIPGAINIFGLGMLDDSGHMRPEDELRSLHGSLDKDKRIITYCGGGILASLNAFAMTRLGFDDVAVYTASMQEWAADADLPLECSNPGG